ncbi:purine-nucleoside phosphorylase [Metapseudomonas otitidis]|uniref:purine-nucleoside phosphorylase n=1 Tax=Metapseudomonas otitidis TaxID=319939 RepID=UPI00280B2E15|nr:purine-nucleoside phosphorylase [Pseudomonas otitidis]
MTTPHINARPGDFAETVLMPGDPLRARAIAETFLEDVREVNAVRNMLGYTGRYRGQRVSVMGSGMGIPSISLYAHELFSQFGVQRIIRVGSCGALQPDVHLHDLVIAQGASTDSGVNRKRFGGFDFAALADYRLLARAVNRADEMGMTVHVGNVFSADLFYEPAADWMVPMSRMGILAVEMEAAGLYGVAAELGREALAVLTVSDQLLTGERLGAQARQDGLHDMIRLVLEGVIA